MHNPRLAGRYAKSIIDLAIEKNQLDVVYADMQYLEELCKVSIEFTALLKSPVVKGDKKQAVLDAVTKGKISAITEGFNKLLISKHRENVLPEIATAFIEQYNEIKGIHKVKLTTAQPLTEAMKTAILAKITGETEMKKVELESLVNEDLIGGFVLEYNNNLVDASILRDLRDIKKQFMNNEFVMKIR
ncbi:MAG: ATP synthase F1 subunit delta [Chitinophagaceae bacterium]